MDALQARRLQPVEAEVVAGVGAGLDVEVELHELAELHLEEVDVLDPPVEVEVEVEAMEAVVSVEAVVAVVGDGGSEGGGTSPGRRRACRRSTSHPRRTTSAR